jgi:prephenate dehydrogenase
MKIGILGYGQFGEFMTKHLAPHTEVHVYSRREVRALPEGARAATLQEACAADIVIFAVPMNAFEVLCVETKDLIPKTSVIVDVTSVKVPPLALLKKYFPSHQIVGTHPIFGPQSGKDGIAGLPLVLCNVSCAQETYILARNFCSQTLGLVIHETTPEKHDAEMASVQGLTHFIGRALAEMHVSDSPLATQSYKQLVELIRLVGSDSWELFQTIENENPDAHVVRAEFLKTLHSLEERLHK